MRDNMRYIDSAKLAKLVESLKQNTAGPTNNAQLERSLKLSSNCITNAKRRGNMNVDDLKRLEGYFDTELEAPNFQVEPEKEQEAAPTHSEGMRLLRENNRILKQLAELWLSGKEA